MKCLYKNADLEFNVSATTSQKISTNIRFTTQDKGTSKLTFKVFKDGVILPLSAATGKIVLKMGDGSSFINSVAIVDKVNGIAEYVLTEDQLKHPGTVHGELLLHYENNQSISVHRFIFSIEKSLIDSNIQPTAEYYVDDFQSLKESIELMADETEQKINEAEDKINLLVEQTGQVTAAQVEEAKKDIKGVTHQTLSKRLSEDFGGLSAQMAQKANETDVRFKDELIDTGDITPALQSQIAGETPIANSIPANQSVTPPTVHPNTFKEIERRRDIANITKQKHGQFINKFVGNKDGTRDLSADVKDKCSISFVDSADDIPYPKEIVSKMLRISYQTPSAYWYKRVVFTDINKPEISGYWVRKSDLLKVGALNNLVWFFDSSNTSLLLINKNRNTSLLKVGYKDEVISSGITVTLEVKEEYGDWLYISQKIDKKLGNSATVAIGFFIANIAIADKVDIVGWTQLEGSNEILPYFIYPESESERIKTEAEISHELKIIKDTLSTLQPTESTRATVDFGYNLEKPLLKYRSKLAKRNAITTVACIGDSITEGFWSGLNWDRAYPVQLRKLMQAKYGGQDEGLVTVNDTDRWSTTGSGWTSTKRGIACMQKNTNVSGNKLSFTFSGVGVDIIYSKNSDGGTCAVKIDGVDKTALNCNGSLETLAQTQSYTGLTSGQHTLEIFAPTDGKKVYIEGAYVKIVGDTSGVRVDRRGLSGSYTGNWNTALQLQAMDSQPADLFIIALGINDCGSGHTPELMKTRLQTIIDKAKTIGSVILIPMMQSDEVKDTRFVNWKDYVEIYYELADENNIGLIDVYKLFGESYQPAQQYGLFGVQNGSAEGSDATHPSARGQQLIADAIFKLIG